MLHFHAMRQPDTSKSFAAAAALPIQGAVDATASIGLLRRSFPLRSVAIFRCRSPTDVGAYPGPQDAIQFLACRFDGMLNSLQGRGDMVIGRRVLLASTTMLALLWTGPALSQDIQKRWMGSGSCATWTSGLPVGKIPQIQRTDQSINNLIMLSWVLGFLSGEKSSPLSNVDIPTVANWLDKYCSANPSASMPMAAFSLQDEILRLRRAQETRSPNPSEQGGQH